MARHTMLEPTVGAHASPAADDDIAVAIIDDALMAFAGRALVSGDEVVDRLLDLRNALIAATLLRTLDTVDTVDTVEVGR